MLKYNKAMENAFSNLGSLNSLSADLNSIAESGFYQKDGCEFLRYFEKMSTNVSLDSFEDRTGYECFINSIHVDDFADSDWLGNALLFASRLLDAWSAASHPEGLQIILTSGDYGATVKAHVVRVGEAWLEDDLEGYEEPILLATSDGGELKALIKELPMRDVEYPQ